MEPAFVFIDLIEDFFAKGPLCERRSSIVEAVNQLTRYARSRSFPVVWVRQEFEPDLSDAFLTMRDAGVSITVRGTGGSDLLAELEVGESDHEIIKKRYSAFFGTRLQALLAALGRSHVVIGGVNSHACVRCSAVDAFQLDYRVILARDSTFSYDDDYHRESMRYLGQSIGRVMSNGEITGYLGGPPNESSMRLRCPDSAH